MGMGDSFLVSASNVSYVLDFVSIGPVIPTTDVQSCYSFSVSREHPSVYVSTSVIPFDSVSPDKCAYLVVPELEVPFTSALGSKSLANIFA